MAFQSPICGSPQRPGARFLSARRHIQQIEILEQRLLMTATPAQIFVANANITAYSGNGAFVRTIVPSLNKPYAMAVSGSDLFIVNDSRISEYAASGKLIHANLVVGLRGPTAIAIAGSDLFVAEDFGGGGGAGRIAEYTTSGKLVNAALVSGLKAPNSLAISGGDLFVVEKRRIGEYTTAGATVNASFILPAEHGAAAFIALDGTHLFVESYYSENDYYTVSEYTTAGAVYKRNLIDDLNGSDGAIGLAIFGSKLIVLSEFFASEYTNLGKLVKYKFSSFPSGGYLMASIAASGSNLFIARVGGGGSTLIDKYTTSSATVNYALISDIAGDRQMVVSGTDLYFMNGGGIGEFTTSGRTVNDSLISDGNFFSFAVSGSDIFVADAGSGTHNGKIAEYTTAGKLVNPGLITGLRGPTGIIVLGNRLFVVQRHNTRISEYTTAGQTVNASLIQTFSVQAIAGFGSNLYLLQDSGSGAVVSKYTTAGDLMNNRLISVDESINMALSGSDLYLSVPVNRIAEYTTSGKLVNAALVSASGSIAVAPIVSVPSELPRRPKR